MGATKSRATIDKLKKEIKCLPFYSGVLLLGDIADPTEEGYKQIEELYDCLEKYHIVYSFVPGNNDWWMSRVRQKSIPKILHTQSNNYRPLVPWLYTMEGGNYSSLPWSHHHDLLSYEEERNWATLLKLDCPKEATVFASHFPFISIVDNLKFAMPCWDNALSDTNIKTLVFGHLHKPYFDSIPQEYKGYRIQLVSDHREQLLHKIIK